MIAKDKKLHIFAGLVLGAVGAAFGGFWIGVAAGVVVGAAKEIYDAMGYGTPDVWDFVFTACAGIIAAGVVALAL